MPPTVSKVVQLAMDPKTAPKDLAAVIRLDPILSFQVLRLVNSAMFGVRNEITSINQAVVLLGINTVKNLALSLGLASKLGPKDAAYSGGTFSHEMFWKHSVAVAICAMLVARKLNVPRAQHEEFFLAGLLHDVGKVVIFNADPERYEKALKESIERAAHIKDTERSNLGTDHKEIGELLARRWSMSSAVVSGIIDVSERTAVLDAETKLLGQAVEIANDCAQRMGYGIESHHHITPSASMWESLGLVKEDVDAYIVEKLPEEFDRAQAFLQSILSPTPAAATKVMTK